MSVDFEWPSFIQRMFARTLQPVVVHSVRLRHIIDSEDGEPDSLVAVLEFNDEQADVDDPEHVDLNELKSSLDDNGTFFIWTCSCGAPGCAGLFDGIRVTHSDGVTSWHDVDCKRKFVFKSQDLREAFRRGITDGKHLLKDRPTLEPTPEQNDSVYRNDGKRLV